MCVVTGRPADGYCPIPVRRSPFRQTTVRLPLVTAAYDRWVRTSLLRLRAAMAVGAGALGAAVTVRFPTLATIFVVVALVGGAAWFVAALRLPKVTPDAEIEGSKLILTDAHPTFAEAVARR